MPGNDRAAEPECQCCQCGRRHGRQSEEMRLDPVVHLLVGQEADIAAVHHVSDCGPGTCGAFWKQQLEFTRGPQAHRLATQFEEQFVDCFAGRGAIHAVQAHPVGRDRRRHHFPVCEMARDKDRRTAARGLREQVFLAHHLPARSAPAVLRNGGDVRQLGDRPPEIVPHPTHDPPPCGAVELRHRAAQVRVGHARDRKQRSDQTGRAAAEVGRDDRTHCP